MGESCQPVRERDGFSVADTLQVEPGGVFLHAILRAIVRGTNAHVRVCLRQWTCVGWHRSSHRRLDAAAAGEDDGGSTDRRPVGRGEDAMRDTMGDGGADAEDHGIGHALRKRGGMPRKGQG